MLGIERRQKIIDILMTEKKVYVAKLAREFKITEETVRRDLEKLESKNLLKRSYGGAVLIEHTSEDFSFDQRSSLHMKEKNQLALLAANLIENDDTIFMDSSTTVLAMRPHLEQKENLTVITNSTRLLYDAAQNTNMTIISSGGRLKENSYALVGPTAMDTITKYHTDVAIISCKALNPDFGSMESNEEESVIKQHMVQNARRSILLVDHFKLDQCSFVNCCKLKDFTYIVTDEKPAQKWIDLAESNSINLVF